MDDGERTGPWRWALPPMGRVPASTGRVGGILRGLGLASDPGSWLEEGRLLACAYPRRDAALAGLARRGVTVLVNLHKRAHDPVRLARYGLTEVHLPVADFTAPTLAQVDRGVAVIREALGTGGRVAVHCGAGLGRTGTLLACYLVAGGLDADVAIARGRGVRPGAVETAGQAAAVATYACRVACPEPGSPG